MRLTIALGLFLAACSTDVVQPAGREDAGAGSGPDAACLPSCDGRKCGDDSCGGTCGACAAGSAC